MIIQEHFDVNGQDFIRTYSDAGRYVVRDGIEYSEACDPANLNRQYTEGGPMSQEEVQFQTEEMYGSLGFMDGTSNNKEEIL